jgi:hypothetical protein
MRVAALSVTTPFLFLSCPKKNLFSIKGTGPPDEYFLKANFSSVCKCFFYFGCDLRNKKNNFKVSACFFETLTNSEDCSESRTRISVPAFLRCHWSIFSSVHVIVGFRNDFLNQTQLLDSQGAT